MIDTASIEMDIPLVACPESAAIPSVADIIALCHANGYSTNQLLFPSSESPRYFIKYGSEQAVATQARTQDYIYHHTLRDPAAPRVPRVYLAFSVHGKFASPQEYMVMEYIPHPTVEKWLSRHPEDATIIRPLVVSAVGWILALPVPAATGVGPVGGGVIRHVFFKDQEAPYPFPAVANLQAYVNRALRFAVRDKRVTVDFSAEPLQFCDSDPVDRNFLYDSCTNQLWRVDFEHVSILPSSFAIFGLRAHMDRSVAEMADNLGLTMTENARALYPTAGLLLMCDGGLGRRVAHIHMAYF
ncbi:hypothetical protein C8Q77DRAFT_1073526 [Trametes polyzona]|nr:hypothetical protein C8Q77DRAFT_1073526 [Trametes polyzona]